MATQSSSGSTSSPSSSHRHHDIQDLINRFFVQLRQGCGVSTCSTSLCATARSPPSSPPLRSYTAVSARAMAVVLASSENALDRLCPNLPSHLPAVLAAPQEKLDSKAIMQQLFNSESLRNIHSLEDTHTPRLVHERSLSGNSFLTVSCDDLVRLCDATCSLHLGSESDQHIITARNRPYTRLDSIFSDFTNLAQSFSDDPMNVRKDPETHRSAIYSVRLHHALESVHALGEDASNIVFDSTWRALEPIFESPFDSRHKGPRTFQTISSDAKSSSVSDVVYRAIHTLTSFVPRAGWNTWYFAWSALVHGRAHGKQMDRRDSEYFSPCLPILDAFEQDTALRMAKRLVRAIGARTCLEETLSACSKGDAKPDPRLQVWQTNRRIRSSITDLLVQEEQNIRLASFKTIWRDDLRHGGELVGTTSLIWLEWLRKCFLKEWDGSLRINRWSVAGSALELIEDLWNHKSQGQLDMPAKLFMTPAAFRILDVDKAAQDWLSYKSDVNSRHLLSFKFLFSTKRIIQLVRTSHHILMRRAYNEADATWHLRRRTMPEVNLQDVIYLDRRLRASQDHYLVLKINRHSILSDAFDQLWHREKRELLRPLRIRMGIDEGEIGHDLGGVQIEFFKLVCQEAFSPGYYPQTRLSWFQPATLVPLYKYQLFGVLFALAIYNGITLPVSFPLVFYKKLLFQQFGETDLAEGWPSLNKSLQYLRTHQGSVEEDFARDYVYSFSANGLHLDVSMDDPWNGWSIWGKIKSGKGMTLGLMKVIRQYPDKHHPEFTSSHGKNEHAHARSDSEGSLEITNHLNPENQTRDVPQKAQEPDQSRFEWPGWKVKFVEPNEYSKPVTNENRHQYISSYAKWVLDWSIRPQFNAFAKGFYSVMNLRPLTLLNADQFRTLVEGHNHLDIDALQRATTYNHYTETSPVIRWFWEVVKAYPQEKQKQLLEFVTASSRVPVNGAESLTFVIERSDSDTNALPGSSTCFSTLRLPEYQSKEILTAKLDIALEHSLGFGQA
ncbi:hypothetical protein D6C86_00299 [Aureobasidium pullulans]|uniref:HECT-type E3 ubiquitin transferase n=1 Tax=Aureobasidium pullulans TaxID=5580 RepID=A0A4S9WQM9_AURPU|nr:hypothetical protein D6C94_01536 [Aureobasidium pullulans]THZ48293.1 hypothetical protein D6C87_00863 [Aureobasidium pullulans]THZ68142.1 hypothetical protein D6C86_00299 [Aureobasidium pullulans]